jgi:hypothetical protein
VKTQDQGQGRCGLQGCQRKPAGSDQEQQGDEAQVHWLLRWIAVLGMAIPLEHPQPHRTEHKADATDGAQQLGQPQRTESQG